MPDPGKRGSWQSIWRGADAGITFGVEILLPTLGGWWLDRRLGWTPALTIVGLLFGFAAGIYHFIRTMTPRD